jgi:hypothetical protein
MHHMHQKTRLHAQKQSLHTGTVQGASGIDARFLKLSPALPVILIMTKFSQ